MEKLTLLGKNQFYFGIIEANAMIRRYEKYRIKKSKLDITPKMLKYIAFIDSYPNISPKKMLDFIDISKGSLSNMVSLLIKKGFLLKTQDEKDKRKTHLQLTKQGQMVSQLNDDIRLHIKKYIEKRLTKKEVEIFSSIALKLRD